ncbi:nuclear transport factor 2 family protein [Massilia horti]|uniref:Nuclear transport factor 2 family protein n=1 Tax=Massilia horti TaxID=2562153 RepID=A0A4Y9SMI2_9BURK|nr:nuclear transport factor 2 family protein [Massilia horti]TFW27860.1 nuclear transport factor 2 family protein [Massilia horti]
MSQEQVRNTAQHFIGQLQRLEQGEPAAIDGIAEMFAEDASLTNPFLEQLGRERVGRDEIKAFWRAYRGTFGTVHSEFGEITCGDHTAGLFWHSDGTGPDGQPIVYDGATLLEFDPDGKIARLRGYFEPDKLRVPLGRH